MRDEVSHLCPTAVRKVARPAGIEPATLGLEGCVPVSEAAWGSTGYEDCHADVPRGFGGGFL